MLVVPGEVVDIVEELIQALELNAEDEFQAQAVAKQAEAHCAAAADLSVTLRPSCSMSAIEKDVGNEGAVALAEALKNNSAVTNISLYGHCGAALGRGRVLARAALRQAARRACRACVLSCRYVPLALAPARLRPRDTLKTCAGSAG
jgi:hypothetical protein